MFAVDLETIHNEVEGEFSEDGRTSNNKTPPPPTTKWIRISDVESEKESSLVDSCGSATEYMNCVVEEDG